MEANKDEALQCLERARKAFREGDIVKARRLANKSKRLFSTKEADELIQKLTTQATTSEHQANSSTSGSSTGRSSPERDTNETTTNDNEPKYTQEQKEAVEKVLRCKDYYKILGVSSDCSESELKKQYKKLALQFHPDKNNAPKADEAFKKISKAYHVLSDPEKKSNYDQFGEEGPNHTINHGFHFNEDFEFDLFRQMFGGDPFGGNVFFYGPGGNVFNMRRRYRHHHHDHHSNFHHHFETGPSAQRVPSLFLLLFSVPLLILTISFLFSSAPPYSLHRTNYYPIKRETVKHKLSYYVQRTFKSDYPESHQKRQIESMVIQDYIDHYRNQCSQDIIWKKDKDNLPHSCQRYQDISGRKIRYR